MYPTLKSELKRYAVRMQDFYWEFKGEQEISRNGVSATFDATMSGGGHLLRWMNKHESVFLDELLSELQPDDVFWDVGANLGLFTCLAMDRINEGSVYAFEPYPPNAAQLRENIQRNGGTATAVEVALSDSDETKEFFHPKEDEVGYQRSSLGDKVLEESGTVTTRRGDSLITDGDVEPPEILKIDVEGAEYAVASGLEDALSNPRCRCVLCEVHLPADGRPSIEDFGGSVTKLTGLLHDAGFETTQREERGDAILLKVEK